MPSSRCQASAASIRLSSRPSDRREREPGSMDGPGTGRRNGPRLALASSLVRGDSGRKAAEERSEEQTSELQSLMRHSYAVFCLKKKNKRKRAHRHKNYICTN